MLDDIFPDDEDPFADDDTEFEGSLSGIPVATLRAFLVIAILAQVGLFVVSLGAMLAGFRGQTTLGGGLAAVGALALLAAALVYRRYAP